jgi:hypothetical protein
MLDGAKKAWTRKPRDIPNGVSRSMLAKSHTGHSSASKALYRAPQSGFGHSIGTIFRLDVTVARLPV